MVNGLDVFQSGEKGQQNNYFTRGLESNHTLVLLNGIAISDQSVTDGPRFWLVIYPRFCASRCL